VDSSLVSIVKDLEQEAERLLQEANAKAASEKAESMQATEVLVKKIETEALDEAKHIHTNTHAELKKELAESRGIAKSSLDQNILKANSKVKKAVHIILERLIGS
jgi:vacuolar-type H+-ATPase subunit E/Vma4